MKNCTQNRNHRIIIYNKTTIWPVCSDRLQDKRILLREHFHEYIVELFTNWYQNIPITTLVFLEMFFFIIMNTNWYTIKYNLIIIVSARWSDKIIQYKKNVPTISSLELDSSTTQLKKSTLPLVCFCWTCVQILFLIHV